MSTGGTRLKPDEFLQRVLDAAQSHGANSEPEHEVGDLQGVVWALWKLLPLTRRASAMANPDLLTLIEDWWVP